MKIISAFLLIILFVSCKKNSSQDYTINSLVQIVVVDNNDNDLLDTNTNGFIPLDDITLTVSGDNDMNNGKPPFYPYFTTIDFASPVETKIIRWSDALNKNSLEIVLDHTFSNTNTIIEWNNGFSPDTLRGEMIFDKKRRVVKCVKLYLNEDIVWTETSNQNRIVKIKKPTFIENK